MQQIPGRRGGKRRARTSEPHFQGSEINQFLLQRRKSMSSIVSTSKRHPKLAFSDFDFIRIVIDFIGDVANSLNAVLTFIRNLINFPS
ncbi:MAG: hypothetical protein KF886_10020 [Candidatus Hydrogenedentes bacterium]|nr:hypothetical protein [Candidatus Hydrogenedentota bacterium]